MQIFLYVFLLFFLNIDVSHSQQILPINAAVNVEPTMVFGSDNQYHVVYELKLTTPSKQSAPYTLTQVDVLDKNSNIVVTSYTGEKLDKLSFVVKPNGTSVNTTNLEAGNLLIVFSYLNFAQAQEVPNNLIHRFTFTHDGETFQFDGAPTKVSKAKVDLILSPLKGGGWLAVNGLGEFGSHRFAYLQVKGEYHIGQRYAIDWNVTDEKGFVYKPGTDMKKNESYYSFGKPIYSVSNGYVIHVSNEFTDNTPFTIPDNVKNAESACGNEVSILMNNGHVAHFCHLKQNSIKVQIGEKVYRNKEIAQLGNSGNSMGPHLHFHISDGKSPLGSEGVPFVIGNFGLEVTPARVEEIGILDFHGADEPILDLNIPGTNKANAIPMQNGIYYFN